MGAVPIVRGMLFGLLVCSLLSGCMTMAYFESNATTVSETDVCKARQDGRDSGNRRLFDLADQERQRRGMTDARCFALLAERQQQINMHLRALAAGLAIGAASQSPANGGVGFAPAPVPATPWPQPVPLKVYDYQWAWDQFYNDQFQLVWACRGVQTGQFAELYRCNGLLQIDNKWPSKSAKLNF
jgi:hypothetical protein